MTIIVKIIHTNAFSSNVISLQDTIKIAKLSLIQGNAIKARNLLEGLSNQLDYRWEFIRLRLLGLSYYATKEYEEALKLFDHPYWKTPKHAAMICPLMIELFAKTKKKSISKYSDFATGCIESTLAKSAMYNYWPQLIFDSDFKQPYFFLEDFINKSVNATFDQHFSFVKGKIFFNKEFDLAKYILSMDIKLLKTTSFKELLAYGFYKNKQISYSKKLLTGLDTLNTHLLQGIFLLSTKDFELANADFSKALNLKPTSLKILKAITPLQLKLKQWMIVDEMLKNNILYDDQDLLKTYVLLKQKIIQPTSLIENKYKTLEKIPTEILIQTHLRTTQTPNQNLQALLEKSCMSGTMHHCQLLKTKALWPDFASIIMNTNSESTAQESNWDPKLENPLNEVVIIRQKDIEDLDDRKDTIDY